MSKDRKPKGIPANRNLLCPSRIQTDLVQHILMERDRQDEKHGAQRDANDFYMQAALNEEVLEASKALFDRKADELRDELVQVAAMALKWLEILEYRARLFAKRTADLGAHRPPLKILTGETDGTEPTTD